MSTKLLSAFTAFKDAPPFVNASLHDDGNVEVMVRSEATIREGSKWPVADFASMKMTREEFITWAAESLANLGVGVGIGTVVR